MGSSIVIGGIYQTETCLDHWKMKYENNIIPGISILCLWRLNLSLLPEYCTKNCKYLYINDQCLITCSKPLLQHSKIVLDKYIIYILV